VLVVRLLGAFMDKREAQEILSNELARFSQKTYTEPVPLAESRHIESVEVPGASGKPPRRAAVVPSPAWLR
jgi:hypothetical protein